MIANVGRIGALLPSASIHYPMRRLVLLLVVIHFLGSTGALRAQVPALATPAPRIQLVPVDGSVKLEVVDWGGSGPPLVLLAALGTDAHEFDSFAPKLTDRCHVYGVTRRGFGASSKPNDGYSNERLGQDILAVLDSLKIDRALFAGHSMSGMELSWLGTHHPERVLGLIYIEAAYGYAFYSEASHDPTNLILDALELQRKLPQLPPGGGRPDQQRLTSELLTMTMKLEGELREHAEQIKGFPDPEMDPAHPPNPPVWLTGIYQGLEKYTKIDVPALAIFAVPHALDNLGDPQQFAKDPKAAAAAEAADTLRCGSQADAFQKGAPQGQVVRSAHANHFILDSNGAEVLALVRSFIDGVAKETR